MAEYCFLQGISMPLNILKLKMWLFLSRYGHIISVDIYNFKNVFLNAEQL